jgi:hypothetical protein
VKRPKGEKDIELFKNVPLVPFKAIKGRLLKITYKPEDGDVIVITTIAKGE